MVSYMTKNMQKMDHHNNDDTISNSDSQPNGIDETTGN